MEYEAYLPFIINMNRDFYLWTDQNEKNGTPICGQREY